ncbi:MAG: hypothetical protein H6585_06865 [Flavobacteriales bacterium]|nr:hypothetical protein [Flavobacteriales bacterium]
MDLTLDLVTEYPLWFVIFCLLAGATYAVLLYRRDRRFSEAASWLPALLGVFRFLTVSLLAFFLLAPMLKYTTSHPEKPIVILAMDNSSSIVQTRDSNYYRQQFLPAFQKLAEDLKADYDVETFRFDDAVQDGLQADFKGVQTDFSALLNDLEDRYAYRNVGAVILASDGLINKGLNPLYANGGLHAPMYTVALGDTSVQKDLLVQNVNYNRLAFLNNEYPLEIVVAATECKGENPVLTVEEDGKALFTRGLTFTEDQQVATMSFNLTAKKLGMNHLRVRLSRLEGEVTYVNNTSDVFVDVIDSRQRIFIVAHAPHPDVAALKTALAKNSQYEVTSALINDVSVAGGQVKIGNEAVDKASLVILHDLPIHDATLSTFNGLMNKLNERNIPRWLIISDRVDLPAFNELNTGIAITGNMRGNANDVGAEVNPAFSLFTIDEGCAAFLKKVPPLQAPFGEYQTRQQVYTLMKQKIASVSTESPLLYFMEDGERKWGVLTGIGIWRWKLREFAATNSYKYFEEWVGKSAQFLAVKADRSLFRITSHQRFGENETVELDAELYNESYELVNDPDVSLEITSEDGKKYNYIFSRTSRAYHLNAGVLPPARYTYVGTVNHGGKVHTARGEFLITALQAEALRTQADHSLLHAMAGESGGQLIYPADLNRIPELLKARGDIASILISEKKLHELITQPWLMGILILLLAVEWFLRKRNGVY